MTRPGGSATDADVLGNALVETVRRTGAGIGGLFLLTPDEQLLCLDVVCGVPAGFAEPWSRIAITAPAPVADSVRDDRLVWVGSHEELARSYPRSAVALPFPLALAAAPVTGVRRWGALLLMWPAGHRNRMTGRERAHVATQCRRLALLLDEAAESGRPYTCGERPRVLPVETGRRDAQPPSAAADFAERLPGGSCALDLDGRLSFVTSGGAELLGRSAGQLLGTRPWQSLPWLDDPAYEDRYRAAVLSRRPVSFTACRPPDQWLSFHLYPDASGISVRIVPSGAEPPAAPAPAVPSMAASAPARPGQLYQLLHLAAALTEVIGVQDVVDLVADQIMPAFGAQGLVLSAAEAGRLKIMGHRGYPASVVERLDGLPIDTRFTPAGQVLATGIPLFFAFPAEMAEDYPEAPQVSGKQAWAFLPLIVSGRPVGCCVLTYDRPHAFSAEERAVMASLAGLIAQAFDRARLYDAKHQLAHGLQQALLPHSLPAIDGLDVAARYLPATRGMDIGGDFYDLIPLGDTAAAAVIGDVQGHNVEAAALMGQVRTAVHAYSGLGAHPDEVLSGINGLLTDLDTGLFSSCLYAHIDLARGCVRLANAGHPPPLLRHPDRRTHPIPVPAGPLLGVVPDATYPVTEIPLTEGRTLVFYTDGLVETPGVDLDVSVARLAAKLTRADEPDLGRLVDALLREAPDGRRHRTDDIAVLVLRCRAASG
ncbi:SpoIIE family protein phosphatase [Streptomyces peucetius]|uniref:SpoIIE family protein phosphatase n=1 Tax=Streptomyces peucetius TaxID=1950 RepID=A0ABY6I453_STRPE|nr:SpoIIE family protein phosphatase [Streptomyces peucetius]UYQ61050.1 SpoIIE family protein phosphatase [Streptomyces peucetius]